MQRSLTLISYLVGFLSIALLVHSLTVLKFDTLKISNGLRSADVITAKTRERQLDCLALNIYREAGYESFEGKVAVAQVTMNRVNHGNFPKDVCGVVYQKTVVMEKVVCQFSWYCDAEHRNKPINRAVYEESYNVAKKVLLENFRLDSVKDALYYHAAYVNPRWNKEQVAKIGQHIFYKDPVKRGNRYAAL